MRYIKMLGLLAVAAAALMAFAGTASATSLTSPGGFVYTSTIKASSTHTQFHGSFVSVTCTSSTLELKVDTHGQKDLFGNTLPAQGGIRNLTFSGCNYPITVLKAGSLSITTAGATSNGNGTLTLSGLELNIHSSIGECIFTTNNTDIGTLTGSTTKHAVIDISAAIPRTGGSFFCGSTGTWTGSYTVTTPSTLYVH